MRGETEWRKRGGEADAEADEEKEKEEDGEEEGATSNTSTRLHSTALSTAIAQQLQSSETASLSSWFAANKARLRYQGEQLCSFRNSPPTHQDLVDGGASPGVESLTCERNSVNHRQNALAPSLLLETKSHNRGRIFCLLMCVD